ncbi:arsenosugar biosynthesis radical SAM (seleno)protein ArsS [Candidatus Sumerlaeota bacterium]
MNSFEQCVSQATAQPLCGKAIEILQVNLGRMCDLACAHCHLACSPARGEVMNSATMEAVVEVARLLPNAQLDITGGAPELHPSFREFVSALRSNGCTTQTRTNLTALLLPESDSLIEFLRDHEVGVVASLPCYLEGNVRAQRGKGVYEKAIEALRRLNERGYGDSDRLPLDLVYNPVGAELPGDQAELEAAYRRELDQRHGVAFRHLFTITNMPIGRFRDALERDGAYEKYVNTLERSFNPATLDGLMCRRQVCVDWDGRLYDCDFNLALELAVDHGAPDRIEAFAAESLAGRTIVTGEHCFGCTAGQGASCGGALV